MGTQIEDCPFVDLGRLILSCVNLRVVLYKVAYPLNKLAVLFLSFEILFF